MDIVQDDRRILYISGHEKQKNDNTMTTIDGTYLVASLLLPYCL